MSFVHLHVHTDYSLLDGACSIPKLIDKAKELGQKAIAITDHGSMFGVVNFYKYAIDKGIKPIIGCEVYTAPKSMYDKNSDSDSKYGHLVLLAKNNDGYKNLIKLVSNAYIDGYYYKPRIDLIELKKYSEGLIGLSACLAGDIPKLLLEDRYDDALKKANEYINIFGTEDFYIELQNHNILQQQRVNIKLNQLANELGLKTVATNDIHYVDKSDAFAQEVLMCVQTKKTITEEHLKFETEEFYLKSEAEMRAAFSMYPDSLYTTHEIADKCNVTFDFNKRFLPKFPTPQNINSKDYLKELCYKGFADRYGGNRTAESRLLYELNVINDMGFTDYFLIVWDVINYARNNNIPVGPGRGSAAGSIVSYCLYITDIDPLKYSLYFERFLNAERISMPDIDMDFCNRRRHEVIEYVTKKYGTTHVAQIATFDTMAPKRAVRDVSRVMEIPYSVADEIAKLIPNDKNITLKKCINDNSKINQLYISDIKIKKMLDVAMQVENVPRNVSTHAAGIVITDSPVSDYVPLYKTDEQISTQFTMTVLEELGLLKMDFLGLRTLTVIDDTIKMVGGRFTLDDIDFHDENVFNMLGSGDSVGVFQLEKSGMRKFMSELKPKSLEDIIAGIALYRPGPMDSIPTYIKNKNNPSQITYLHSVLEPILSVTYGCIVYQEQVMEIVQKLAGFSLGMADVVRRAMSKKKPEVMEKVKKEFLYGVTDQNGKLIVKGAVNNGIDEKTALDIINDIMSFASYAFNKSHAAAYAVVAYRTAYLKYHYPKEFMAALMSSFLDNLDKVAEYIDLSKNMGIEVIPPSVNESFDNFSVFEDKIIFGMAAIKNVGLNFVSDVLLEREKNGIFKSFFDFCDRMAKYSSLNKKAVESLIKCGAFDCMSAKRSQLMSIYEQVLDSASKLNKYATTGQVSFFGGQNQESEEVVKLPDVAEIDINEKLIFEKELLGVYVSAHPIDKFKNLFSEQVNINTLKLKNILKNDEELTASDGKEVCIAVIINSVKLINTKNNSTMAFVKAEDKFGTCEIVVFPNIFKANENVLANGSVVLVNGKISIKDENSISIIASKIVSVGNGNTLEKLYIKITSETKDKVSGISKILKQYPGKVPVLLYFEDEKITKTANYDLWVSSSPSLMYDLNEMFGPDNVKLIVK